MLLVDVRPVLRASSISNRGMRVIVSYNQGCHVTMSCFRLCNTAHTRQRVRLCAIALVGYALFVINFREVAHR